jgi:tetratricopeptide (TPR) repeat protein
MLQWLTIRHQSEPEDEMLAGMFERFYPEDAPKIFDGQLSQRPAKILLHRLYQDRKRKNDPQHDLEAEYAKLLEAEPQSGELAYLAGRVASSPKQRATLLEKAASLDPPVAHALAAIGFQLMSEGKYVEALEKVQAAIDLKPKSVQFQFMRNRCFFALQKYTEVIDWARTTKLGAIAGARVFMEESSAIAQAGGQEDGLSELQGRVRLQTEIMGAEMFESYWAAVKGTYDYARRGTTAESLAKAAEQDIQEVRDGVDGSEESATDHLFLYAVESIAGNAQQAQSHLDSAIAELNKGDSNAKVLAKSLASEQAPNFEEMSVLTEACENKRVWMAALAIRFPDRAADYKNMVAKLNFERKAPYWWLLNWTKQQ